MHARRIGVFGWGLVAPGARDVDAFAASLARVEDRLTPFRGFGPSNFLVGEPDFDFADYKPWLDARFPPSRYQGLDKKFGGPTKFAIGAFIQALRQNAPIEAELRELGVQAQVIVGGGLTDLPTYDRIGRELHRAQRRWNRFWSAPVRNAALREHLEGTRDDAAPPDPATVDEATRDDAEEAWWSYWAERSSGLAE